MPNDSNPVGHFEDIVRENQTLVFRTLLRLTGSHDRLEDLAQEVFLRLFRGLPHFKGDSKLSTYLYRIILNVSQDEWKRRRKERTYRFVPALDVDEDGPDFVETLPDGGPDAEMLMAHVEVLEAVDRGLMQLSENERAVLVLYHQEECSYEHIALMLQMPIGTVRTHLHRGRLRLGEMVRAETLPPVKIGERKPWNTTQIVSR